MPKDRTSEFHSTLASIRSRQAVPAGNTSSKSHAKEARQPLLGGPSSGASGSGGDGAQILRAPGSAASGPKADSKNLSEFGRMAGGIAKDINATTAKLGKLAQCEFGVVGAGFAGPRLGLGMKTRRVASTPKGVTGRAHTSPTSLAVVTNRRPSLLAQY